MSLIYNWTLAHFLEIQKHIVYHHLAWKYWDGILGPYCPSVSVPVVKGKWWGCIRIQLEHRLNILQHITWKVFTTYSLMGFFSPANFAEKLQGFHFLISLEGLIKLSSNLTVVGSIDIPSTFIHLDFPNPFNYLSVVEQLWSWLIKCWIPKSFYIFTITYSSDMTAIYIRSSQTMKVCSQAKLACKFNPSC